MKIIEGFRMRQLGRDHIVVGEGVKLVNFNKMIVLNETAAYLWESVVGKEFSVDDLKTLLLDKYEVDETTAAADSEKIARSWIDAGIVTE